MTYKLPTVWISEDGLGTFGYNIYWPSGKWAAQQDKFPTSKEAIDGAAAWLSDSGHDDYVVKGV